MNIPVVPVSGNTGLNGSTQENNCLVVSLPRMSRIRDLRPAGRIAEVEAGCIVDTLDPHAAKHGLTFPLDFAASGSAMIGGVLSTNTGEANVDLA